MKTQSVPNATSVRILGLAMLLVAFLLVYKFVAGARTPSNVTSRHDNSGPVVQAVQSYINPTFSTTHTTAPFESTGGDFIVVCASSHAGVIMTPSDSFNNTWISAAGPTNTRTGFDLRTQVWYAKNPTVGPGHTLTLNLSAAQSLVISVFVVQGSNVSAPLDAISTIGDDWGTQSPYVTSPSITTKSANDLVIGFAKSSVSETWNAGGGFTVQRAASSGFLQSEVAWAEKPGTFSSTFEFSSLGTWQAVVVAVRPPMDGSIQNPETPKTRTTTR